MSSTAKYASLILCLLGILFSHGSLSEGSKRSTKRKYYPEEKPVKTLVLDYGDVVDCVDFYSQPGMRNPSIRSRAKLMLQETTRSKNNSRDRSVSGKLGSVGCPAGSVPFLKATKAGALNQSAIGSFARSRAEFFLRSEVEKPLMDHEVAPRDEYATVQALNGLYGGGKGIINVWTPFLEDKSDFSTSQMWVIQRYRGEIMSVEAGWMVNPGVFGDRKTRFFIFTTPDNYRSWIYDGTKRQPEDSKLAFIRVDRDYAPLGKILTKSDWRGTQREIEIDIQGNRDGDWVLRVDGHLIGFWPAANYDGEFGLANEVHWGGKVFDSRSKGMHTTTKMGSGHYAQEGIGRAAYIKSMTLYDPDYQPYDPPHQLNVFMTNPSCYNVIYSYDESNGRYITVGGPGLTTMNSCY